MSYTVQVGKSYNFVTQVPQVLGTDYNNAKVLALADYNVASAFADVTSIHRQILPLLETGTVSDPALLNFCIISVNSNRKVLAMEWLSQEPDLISTQKISVLVQATPSQLAGLLSAINDNNFNVISYSLVN